MMLHNAMEMTMQYEIFDSFNRVVRDRKFNDFGSAVSYAFVELAEFLSDHIDDELDEGETDVMSICVKNNGDGVWHVWLRGHCDMLHIIRPCVDASYLDLVK